jgi:hypothetical protein
MLQNGEDGNAGGAYAIALNLADRLTGWRNPSAQCSATGSAWRTDLATLSIVSDQPGTTRISPAAGLALPRIPA